MPPRYGKPGSGAVAIGLRVDQPHDLHAEVVALVELARQLEAGRARADHQQSLARTDLPRHPAERQAPPDHAGDGEDRGRRQDAAAR